MENNTEELDRLRSEFNDFIYIVGHDLCGPFRQIQGFSQRLIDQNQDNFDEQALKYMHFINKGAEDGQKILTKLLELSCIQTSKIQGEDIDLIDFFDSILQILSKAENLNIDFIDIDVNGNIFGDKILLQRAFIEVIKNAIIYKEDYRSHQVLIMAKKQGSQTQIMIEDNGIGIAETKLQEIVKPFRRGVDKSFCEGSGMGLNFARAILQRHNGDLSIQSEVGKYTRIKMSLPIKPI